MSDLQLLILNERGVSQECELCWKSVHVRHFRSLAVQGQSEFISAADIEMNTACGKPVRANSGIKQHMRCPGRSRATVSIKSVIHFVLATTINHARDMQQGI